MSAEIKGYPCEFAVFNQGKILCRRTQVYEQRVQMLEGIAADARGGDHLVMLSETRQQLQRPCFIRKEQGEVTICGASLDGHNNPVPIEAAMDHQVYGIGYKRSKDLVTIKL